MPGPRECIGLHVDGWDQIDRIGVWEAYLCQFSLLEYVPWQHRETWAWAWGEVLRRIDGAEEAELERGLKWLLMLPQLLLRKARRGGQPGRGNVAKRFNSLALHQDWGAVLRL